jgi:hypothetical protein
LYDFAANVSRADDNQIARPQKDCGHLIFVFEQNLYLAETDDVIPKADYQPYNNQNDLMHWEPGQVIGIANNDKFFLEMVLDIIIGGRI